MSYIVYEDDNRPNEDTMKKYDSDSVLLSKPSLMEVIQASKSSKSPSSSNSGNYHPSKWVAQHHMQKIVQPLIFSFESVT